MSEYQLNSLNQLNQLSPKEATMIELIATIPPPHRRDQMELVANHPLITGFRFNTGARTPYSATEALSRLLAVRGEKKFWVDLKGRQPRIVKWADPAFDVVELSHSFTVDLPATLVFRTGERVPIAEVQGNKVFLADLPRDVVGAGQAVNILGTNLQIDGYSTKTDLEYVDACVDLGIRDLMLSFVEQFSDDEEVARLHPTSKRFWKIESPRGLDFLNECVGVACDSHAPFPFGGLVLAADDLMVNLLKPTDMFAAITQIEQSDSQAIAASRILTSLENSEQVSLGDLAYLKWLYEIGYRRFMLSDGLCAHGDSFHRAMNVLSEFVEFLGEEVGNGVDD